MLYVNILIKLEGKQFKENRLIILENEKNFLKGNIEIFVDTLRDLNEVWKERLIWKRMFPCLTAFFEGFREGNDESAAIKSETVTIIYYYFRSFYILTYFRSTLPIKSDMLILFECLSFTLNTLKFLLYEGGCCIIWYIDINKCYVNIMS